MRDKKLISFKNFYRETLPDFISAMPEKGKPTLWLPKDGAICIERFKGYLNDRHFFMTDHDNCHVLAHQLYEIEPNIIVYNAVKPERHQAFWLIRDPIFCQIEVRTSRPYRLLKASETAYDVKYGCDPHFARYIHKNPLYWLADVDWRHDRAHTLFELSDVVDLNTHRVRKGKRKIITEGRNNTLFHDLRHWAYKNALEARHCMSYDDWFQMVITRAIAKNTFVSPLELNEVISVAKSIAEFCYFRYQPKGTVIVTPQYRKLQAKRGAIGGKNGSREDKVKAGSLGGKQGSIEAKSKAGSLGGKRGSIEAKSKAGSLGGSISSGGGRPVDTTSARSLKPWEKMGISRAWYYKQKNLGVIK